ncbi:hypothetical protein LEP1GSC047_0442 [Leptospira inadai serovar Lyme str. 10]|uniref:Lipoprotein n=2 Tax=Leptospira inadai serovar Lyme TaxID=293084 RepID=V6HHT3_9LEPT|nr:hypothetical protein [Leptospira inadai]EQA36070.1 hypothetical protein LEP1GSC047_0442 [Leptospira inadai serovar Lyme str. 10]PNV76922.1 hypothetical protein BES34_001200 [Leptospira inadai serovar Lyme]
MIRLAASCIIVLSFFLLPVEALTPPPTLESQVTHSDFIALARLSNVKESKISANSISVTANIQVLKPIKGGSDLPTKFDLAFLVFPEYFGKWLKAPPQEGDYILFLIKKKVKDSKGKETEVVALYEPHPYAFREYSKELEEKIRAEIKN